MFDMMEEKSIVMAEGKHHSSRMMTCLNLLLQKNEWYKLFSLRTCCENHSAKEMNVELFDK